MKLSNQDLILTKHVLNQYAKYSLNIKIGRIKPSTIIELMSKLQLTIDSRDKA